MTLLMTTTEWYVFKVNLSGCTIGISRDEFPTEKMALHEARRRTWTS